MINSSLCLSRNIGKVKKQPITLWWNKRTGNASLKKASKAAGKASAKANKHTSAVWGFHLFPGLPCDGGLLLPGQAQCLHAARAEGPFPPSSLLRDPDPIRRLLVCSRNKPRNLFPQDYVKILLYSLRNFDVNYIASDLKLLLLKWRDSQQLLHFASRYPSFKTIDVLWVSNWPRQNCSMCSKKNQSASTGFFH